MTKDEIQDKLKGYIKAGGDDAVLPAVLLSLLKSQEQCEAKLAEIKKQQAASEKSALESQEQCEAKLAEIKKQQAASEKSALESQEQCEAKLAEIKEQQAASEKSADRRMYYIIGGLVSLAVIGIGGFSLVWLRVLQ